MANNKTITVSASMIRTFKSCPKKFWYHYVQGISPAEKSEALEIGTNYHEEVADYLNYRKQNQSNEPMLFEKVSQNDYLAQAFIEHIDVSEWEVKDVEKDFLINLAHGIKLRGSIDAIVEVNGKPFLVEHKTVSNSTKIDESYEVDLGFDDQIPIYCGATGIYNILYTVIKKCGLKQKKIKDPVTGESRMETDEEFHQRRLQWYREDTESKIRCFHIRRLEEEVASHKAEIAELARMMRSQKIFYRNKGACSIFGCEHKDYCLDYVPGSLPIGCVRNEYFKGDK